MRIDGGKTKETDPYSVSFIRRRSLLFSRMSVQETELVGAGWSVVASGYIIPGSAIGNAALLGFAFRSKSKALSHQGKSRRSNHPPKVKMTLTVVSTSTGSLLSR